MSNNKKNIRPKCVIILSGGMDSTTLAYDIVARGLYDVYALSFNYGQRHSKELECAKATCKALTIPHRVVSLKSLTPLLKSALTDKSAKMPHGHYAASNMKQTVVPNRNMIMLSIAVGYACSLKAKIVYYGAHAGDHSIYPDCRPDFIMAMQNAIALCDWHIVELYAPYLHMDKGEIAVRGKSLRVDYNNSWTCYEGGTYACGKCGACGERILAFNYAQMTDPVKYVRPWKRVLASALKMAKGKTR